MSAPRLILLAAATASLALFSGCPDKNRPSEVVEAPDASVEAPPPEDLQILITAELTDGGTQPIPTETPERPQIDPAQGLSISTNLALENHRIRLFDETDRVVPSDDETEEPPPGGGIVYRMRFVEPLTTGYRYVLVLDAQTGSFFKDSLGREQAERRVEFQIAGEKPKPPPPPPRGRRR